MTNTPFTVHADLAVKVGPPKITGSKAVVKLEMTNTFDLPVQSARATVFLLDSQNKTQGQSTKWVIGGAAGKPALQVGSMAAYNFVISVPPSAPSTNLQAKVMFNRIVLEGGKLVDVGAAVTTTSSSK